MKDAERLETQSGSVARSAETKPICLVCGASGAGTSTLVGRLPWADTGGAFVPQELDTALWDGAEPLRLAVAAPLGLVVVDAREGLTAKAKHKLYLCALLGARHLVLAVNRMDLIGNEQATFAEITGQFESFVELLEIDRAHAVPVSAQTGANILNNEGEIVWYSGAALSKILEGAGGGQPHAPFRMPVIRANKAAKTVSGIVASGSLDRNDEITSGLSGRKARVTGISGGEGDLEGAAAGMEVTLTLANPVDAEPGDLVAAADPPADAADQIAAHILWLDHESMLPERPYVGHFGAAEVIAQVTDLTHRIDTDSLDQLAAKTLGAGEIGYCKIALDRAVAFDAFSDNRTTGYFTLSDKFTGATVGVGTISFALRRASNIEWHEMTLDKAIRAQANEQKPCVLWFTGFSGSGKSTVADKLEQKLYALGKRTYLLDGDNVRHGLNKDLGFTDQDRVENIRRVAEVAKLMVDAGMIVLTSFISPFRSERQMARALMDEGEFIEVFVNTPLEICEQRDPKGLYKKARAGELKNFTGIDSDYEEPENAEIILKSAEADPSALANQIIAHLQANGLLDRAAG